MSYIGATQGTSSPVLLDSISVVNGQASYTMQKDGVNFTPASTLVMQTSLNGIIQAPNTSFTIDGSTITFASNLATGDVIDYILIREPTTGTVSGPIDGSVTNSKIVSMAASKLTGALPAIDGSALTNLPAGGKVLKMSISQLSTNTTRGSATAYGDDLDFGSFTPSTSNSTVFIQGVANLDGQYQKYTYYKWVIDGTDFLSSGSSSPSATHAFYNGVTANDTGYIPSTIMTSVSNTDGSAITVKCQGKVSSGILYINRTAGNPAGSPSSVIFTEVAS
tara:strand:+ start:699 stop:1532 length:834 start_codon:yes stop_codon:yes gene_type:complete